MTKEIEAAEVGAAKAPQVIEEVDPRVNIELVRYLPPDLIAHFVDNMLVVHTENEFILSFLQTEYPLAATKEELEQVGPIRTKCVARVIVSPNQMQSFIEALQTNFTKYINSYKKTEA